MPLQHRRRIGTALPPPSLAQGQLGYNDAVPSTLIGDDALYMGSTNGGVGTVKLLVGAARQLELAGTQTITGQKTISISNLLITGAPAANMILTSSNTMGGLAWSAAPSGGLLTVAVDGVTITGNGTSAAPLSAITDDGTY